MTPRADKFDFSAFDAAQSDELHVDGCMIRFRRGGNSSGHCVLYIHGGLANSAWWGHLLQQGSRDTSPWAALDLSGHGDSDHRSSYDPALWAEEVLAVASAIRRRGSDSVTLVGHSLGAAVALLAFDLAAGTPGHGIRSVVAIDGVPEGILAPRRPRPASQSRGVYGDVEEGRAEFATRQSRSRWPSELAAQVGIRSLIRANGVWRWKHDSATRAADLPRMDGTGGCDIGRVLLVLGEDSPFRETIEGSDFVRSAGKDLVKFRVKNARHDVMMEQPREFTRILETWLARE
jgi:pimeloyl-ACP methyl ester carboxylesterase